jgi:predicted DNA-binding protein
MTAPTSVLDDRLRVLTIRIAPATYQRLAEVAREHDRSLAAEVRRSIRLHLDEREQSP